MLIGWWCWEYGLWYCNRECSISYHTFLFKINKDRNQPYDSWVRVFIKVEVACMDGLWVVLFRCGMISREVVCELFFFCSTTRHILSCPFKSIILWYLTYLPHEAVAEVSKNKEPIGRECTEFNWFESQLMSDSNELRVKWFGCHLIWDSNDLVVIWFEIQMILVVNWFEIQMIWLSSDLRFKWFWLSIDLRFKWFGCQSMCASNDFGCLLIWTSNDFGCLLIWTSSDVVVNWFEIQVIRLSIDLRFKWFGCQSIWDSNELVVDWFEIQLIWLSIDSNDLVVNRCVLQMILVVCWFELQVMWLSIDLRFKWFGCQLIWDSSDLVVNRFEIQMSWLSIDLRFKWFGCQMIWGSSDLVVNWCVIQMILSNEAFLRNFLQKRSFSARLPSKLKLWSSKTKQFCETSFKNEALKLQNEAFLRDFLQKWSFEAQKRSCFARLPSKMTCRPDTWPQNYNTFQRFLNGCFKSTAPATRKLSRGIRTPVTATRNDPCEVTPPCHEICNPSTDSASKASNIDIAKHKIIAPATRNASFRSLFKSTTPANVFATLTNSCACHVFCNVSKSLRLPRETHFELQKTSRDRQFLTILTSKSLSRAGVVQFLRSSTSKSVPTPPVFNDFDFQIAFARKRGANFVEAQLPKVSRHRQFFTILTSKSLSRAGVVQILSMSTSKSAPNMPVFNDFGFQIAFARRRGANFVEAQLPKVSRHRQFLTILTSKSFSRAGVVRILSTSWATDPSQLPFFGPTFASFRSDKTMEKHSISRNFFTRQNISAVKHRCCKSYRQLSV